MKNRRLSLVALLCGAVLALWADSGIYVCGHFNRSPQTAVPALKQSGYTFGILFNINVEENGDITYEGQTVCRDGVFLLHETSPRFVDDVNSLISGRTSMARLEYCIGGWTNMAYQKITHLVRTVGTGEDSPLYKNFKALKEAIPAVIAVNNDIEHEYDAETQAQFHIMLYDLGFKTTIAPYMNKEYWERFVEIVETARPGAVERNYLQCYGGGAGNQPRDWNIAGLPIYGSWDLEANGFKKDEIVSRLTNWKNEGTIVGGFYWNYNTDRNVRAEAAGINEVFGGGEVAWRSRRVAMVYPVAGYKTPQTDFAMGVYSKEEIEAAGFNPHDVAAIRLVPGVKMTLYTGDDNAGDSLVITADTPDVAAAIGGTEYNSWTVSAGRIGELDGKEFCIRNKQSGLYLKPYSNKTTNGLSVRQRAYDGTDYMLWRFEAVDGGLYRIVNKGSGKTLQFSGESIYEGGKFIQKIYSGRENQHFLVTRGETEGTYRLMVLHSLKYVELNDEETDLEDAQAVQRVEAVTEWELTRLEQSGVETSQGDGAVALYSGVVTDEIRMESLPSSGVRMRLFDLNGRMVRDEVADEGRMDVAEVPSGVYVLFVETAGGQWPFRIVKR